MKKEIYEPIYIEVVKFNTDDIITTSNCNIGGVGDDEGNG